MTDEADRGGRDELGQRLEAYAHARLTPSAAATRRMRDRLMAEAHRRVVAAAPAAADGVPREPGVVVPIAPRRSLLSALAAAACLLIVFAAAAVAARPGGPLYEARLAVEEVLLPADGEARTEADLARLEARLAEAREAAANGNESAIAASLEAYGDVIDDTFMRLESSGVDDEALEDALARHLVVLTDLLDRAPIQALPAIEHAIERSDQAVEKINERPEPGSTGGPSTGPGKEPPGQSHRPDRTPPGQSSEGPPGQP